MFSNPEDDEFFNPVSSSNLASLFGTSVTPKQEGDASLIYTAPKQPKTSGQETPKTSPRTTSPSSVICTKLVDVFKLSDKSHTPYGKCGLAIIGSRSLKSYEIIIYKSKQDIITRSKLKSDFTFTVQSNNFAYFCDEQKQQWSVHFENTKEIDDFAEKIKIHDGKVAYHNKNTNSSDTSQSIVTGTKPKTDENVSGIPIATKDKDSDSTSDNSTNQARANILSRMAKMGQSILPVNVPSKSSGHSDSETDEQTVNRKPVKKKHVPSEKVKTVNNQSLNTQAASVPEFVMINGQLLPASMLNQNFPTSIANPLHGQYIQNLPNQIMLSQPQVPPMSDSLHIFIAENRTHNCEMRMNISQLSSKLDQVLSKMDKSGQVISNETSQINELELKMLEKVKELEENREIINALQQQHSKLQETCVNDEKIISNLKQQNQEFNSVILEQKQKIQEVENQKNVLEEQITHNKPLQENLEEAQATISGLKQTIADQQANLKKLEEFSENYKENRNSEITIDKLNENITTLKSQLADKNSKADLFARKLKQSMNNLYQQIMENFGDENIQFQSTHIKQILSQKLKTATFTIIEEFQNEFKDDDEKALLKQSSELNPPVPQFE